ncbi:DUF6777 domain-containing protein, partial [Streptomyces sp. NPDC005813]|uniref:DUF6777 domain-containing protein n=1 Tax=Streptomyces sp. NPDC005813 TaxID=3155592 RepID=UPI0033CF496E
MALAVVVGLLFSNNSGGGKNTAGEVFLQPAAAAGPDPFTESTAIDTATAPGTSKTGTSAPKTTEPGTTAPKTTEPGTTAPKTTEPGTTAPKTTEPGGTTPKTTPPKTTEPGGTTPKTTEPGGTTPKTTGAPVETRTQGGGTTEVPGNVTRGVVGSAPGLYAGQKNVSPCNVEKQIKALQADPSKARAFASVEGITAGQIPSYLRSLTPVQLSADTRVTNHGYRSGGPTSYQAILQSGTSVLVDSHGVPRTRCGCGNPLKEPVQQKTTPKQTGQRWASFQPQNVVVIAPSVTIINVFVIVDPHDDKWIARYRGDNTHHDRRTHRPPRPFPTVVVTPTPTTPKPTPCVTPTGGGPCAPTTPSSTPSSPSSSSSGPSKSGSSSGPSKSGSSTSPSESSASPSKSEPSKSESSKSESPSASKSEPSKSESSKPESSKSESPSASKSEPSKSESSKPESSKSESPY